MVFTRFHVSDPFFSALLVFFSTDDVTGADDFCFFLAAILVSNSTDAVVQAYVDNVIMESNNKCWKTDCYLSGMLNH